MCSLILSHGIDILADSRLCMRHPDSTRHLECFRMLLDVTLTKCPYVYGGGEVSRKNEISSGDVANACLAMGCLAGSIEVVRMMLEEYGADANFVAGSSFLTRQNDALRMSCLHLCVAILDRDAQYRVAMMLLEHGADPKRKVGGGNGHALNSLLAEAVNASAVGLAEALLSYKNKVVSVTDADIDPYGALSVAAMRQCVDMIRLLLKHGANVNYKGPQGLMPPLIVACQAGRLPCVQTLVEAGADMKSRGQAGFSCLHTALFSGDVDLVQYLLSRGADPNVKDDIGRSPLFYACLNPLFSMILLDYGADPRKATSSAAKSLNILDWFTKEERDNLDKIKGAKKCLEYASRIFQNGFFWPKWTKDTHKHFPKNVRSAIVTTLKCAKRKECVLSSLSKDVLQIVLEYVATRNQKNDWHGCGKTAEDWRCSFEFFNMAGRFNLRHLVPENIQSCLDKGDCTKLSCGEAIQPLYSCVDCSMVGVTHVGACEACAIRCHQKLGHKVYLKAVEPGICECNGTSKCKIYDRIAWLSSKEAKQGFLPQTTYVHLVCTEYFNGALVEDQFLDASPGDILCAKREDLQNNVAIAELRGVSGPFPNSEFFIQSLSEFYVALCDHEGTESGEMSFKRGELILIDGVARKSVKDREGIWRGRRVSSEGLMEGWFDCFMVESCVRCDTGLAEKKLEAFASFNNFKRLQAMGDFVSAIELGLKSVALFGEIAQPNREVQLVACDGMYESSLRRLFLCYAALGMYEDAFKVSKSYVEAVVSSIPPRPLSLVLTALHTVVQLACHASHVDEALRYQKMFNEACPKDDPYEILGSVNEFAIAVASGQINQAALFGPMFMASVGNRFSFLRARVASWSRHLTTESTARDVAEKNCQTLHECLLAGFSEFTFYFLEALEFKCLAAASRSPAEQGWEDDVLSCVQQFSDFLTTPRGAFLLKSPIPTQKAENLFKLVIVTLLQSQMYRSAFDVASTALKTLSLSSVFMSTYVQLSEEVKGDDDGVMLEVIMLDGDNIKVVRENNNHQRTTLKLIVAKRFDTVVDVSFCTLTRQSVDAMRPLLTSDPYSEEKRLAWKNEMRRGTPSVVPQRNWKVITAMTLVTTALVGLGCWWWWRREEEKKKKKTRQSAAPLMCCLLILCFAVLVHSHGLPTLGGLDARLAEKRFSSFHQSSPQASVGAQMFIYTATADHFNGADTRTFSQRYWVDKTFFNGTGPLFVEILGEWAASVSDLESQMKVYGSTRGALLAAVEHRGYGGSLGFNIPISSSQALADFADIVVHLRHQFNITQTIVFGCSYAGNLAAWFRLKYPHIANTGSVASSAPILAVTDFGLYEQQVGVSISDIFGPRCDDAIRTSFSQLSQLLNMTNNVTFVNSQLQAMGFVGSFDASSSTPLLDRQTFAATMMYVFSGPVQYGEFDSVNASCAKLVNGGNNSSMYYPLSTYINMAYPMVSYASFVSSIAQSELSWFWQTCTEFGYYQTTSVTTSPFAAGDLVPIGFYEQICSDIYGLWRRHNDDGNTKKTEKNATPKNSYIDSRVRDTNIRYGGNTIPSTALSRCVFQNSVTDPWARLSIQRTLSGSVPLLQYEGGHCATYEAQSQYTTEDPSVQMVRNATANYIDMWLKQPDK